MLTEKIKRTSVVIQKKVEESYKNFGLLAKLWLLLFQMLPRVNELILSKNNLHRTNDRDEDLIYNSILVQGSTWDLNIVLS